MFGIAYIIGLLIVVAMYGIKYFHYIADIISLLMVLVFFTAVGEDLGLKTLSIPLLNSHPFIAAILVIVLVLFLHYMASYNIKSNIAFSWISSCGIPIATLLIISSKTNDHTLFYTAKGAIIYISIAIISTTLISVRTGSLTDITETDNVLFNILEFIGCFIAWIFHSLILTMIIFVGDNDVTVVSQKSAQICLFTFIGAFIFTSISILIINLSISIYKTKVMEKKHVVKMQAIHDKKEHIRVLNNAFIELKKNCKEAITKSDAVDTSILQSVLKEIISKEAEFRSNYDDNEFSTYMQFIQHQKHKIAAILSEI